jgi:hypothetical protein
VSGFDAPSRRLKLPLVGAVLALGEAESEGGRETMEGAGAETSDDERGEDGEDEDGED